MPVFGAVGEHPVNTNRSRNSWPACSIATVASSWALACFFVFFGAWTAYCHILVMAAADFVVLPPPCIPAPGRRRRTPRLAPSKTGLAPRGGRAPEGTAREWRILALDRVGGRNRGTLVLDAGICCARVGLERRRP